MQYLINSRTTTEILTIFLKYQQITVWWPIEIFYLCVENQFLQDRKTSDCWQIRSLFVIRHAYHYHKYQTRTRTGTPRTKNFNLLIIIHTPFAWPPWLKIRDMVAMMYLDHTRIPQLLLAKKNLDPINLSYHKFLKWYKIFWFTF